MRGEEEKLQRRARRRGGERRGGGGADVGWRVRAVSAGDGELRCLWVSQTRVVARRGLRRERKNTGIQSREFGL